MLLRLIRNFFDFLLNSLSTEIFSYSELFKLNFPLKDKSFLFESEIEDCKLISLISIFLISFFKKLLLIGVSNFNFRISEDFRIS